MLLATVASWDTTLSTALSGAGPGELELELEPEGDEDDAPRLAAAAAAAHSLRLSASFFSLEIPGEEQEVRGVSWVSGVLVALLGSAVFVVALQLAAEGTVVLGPSRVWSSDVVLEACGGPGLRKVSLLTEMNALPGVEKGRGP